MGNSPKSWGPTEKTHPNRGAKKIQFNLKAEKKPAPFPAELGTTLLVCRFRILVAHHADVECGVYASGSYRTFPVLAPLEMAEEKRCERD